MGVVKWSLSVPLIVAVTGLERLNFACPVVVPVVVALVVQLLDLPPQQPRVEVGELDKAQERETDTQPDLTAIRA